MTLMLAGDAAEAQTPSLTFSFQLGGEQQFFPDFRPSSFPDTHITTLQDGQFSMWMSAEVSTFLLRGTSLEDLKPHAVDANGRSIPVLAPRRGATPINFDDEYAAFGSVIPAADGTLVGFYHAEKCGRGNYTATVGITTSGDGVTWSNRRALITGYNANNSCTKTSPSGTGQPNAILIGDFVYVYFVDWSKGPHQTYVARAPYAQINDPAAYRKYLNGAFSSAVLGGDSTAVITRPLNMTYATSPAVSYNTYLQRFVALHKSSDGIYLRTSANGLVWDTPIRILAAKRHDAPKVNGDIFYDYPTLLSGAPDTVTGQKGHVYYAKTVIGDCCGHKLFRKPFTFTITGGSPPSPTSTPTLPPPTPTSTPVLSTPASSPSATPTSTPVPPTPTPSPTPSPTPTPSRTPTPTATASVDSRKIISYLSDLNWTKATNGWGPVERDMSVGETPAGDGPPLSLGGIVYDKGLGAHAASEIRYPVEAGCAIFYSVVGINDSVGDNGSVVFQVFVDGSKRYDSGVMRGGDLPKQAIVRLNGGKELRLVVTGVNDDIDFDHADWADARVECSNTKVNGLNVRR